MRIKYEYGKKLLSSINILPVLFVQLLVHPGLFVYISLPFLVRDLLLCTLFEFLYFLIAIGQFDKTIFYPHIPQIS